MPKRFLQNADFEADWGDEKSHRCVIFPKDGVPYEKNVGNIFVPSGGWVFWFYHDPGKADQPEGRDSWKEKAPERVRSGEKAYMWFTFNRSHDAGLFQQVEVGAGSKLRFTAWMHAWSNGLSEEDGGKPSNGRWSDGAGFEQVAWKAGTLPHDTGDKLLDAKPNFTFQVGIDPTGGTNPFAGTVVWGQGYHIYNGYAKQLEVEAVAESNIATVFVRSKTLWAFKHNDAYIDDAELVITPGGPLPEVRLSHTPRNLKVGDTLKIEARSLTPLTDVGLVVKQPSGAALATGNVVTGRDGDWHTWTYATSATAEAGVHTFTFTAAGGARASATFDCAPEVRLAYWPGEPKVNDEVTVEARSLAALIDVALKVTRPSGAGLAVGNVKVGRDGDWHTWTYALSPANEVGVHTAAFSASRGVRATITIDYAEAEAPVPSERGEPREQYERTYVLLPPDADASWALAAVEATWNQRHYTIGGSADDAGIGNLDARRVIAVNPQEWPDDLQAFFEEHYPGLEYVPVRADTPDDLVQELERL
ncbi:MAG: hypothetical protein JW918_07900 [Anaerolineae bacterium]|nr:hypothetical protein [Anaerolineae bacterium]